MGFTSGSSYEEKIVKIKGIKKGESDPHFEVQGFEEKATKFVGSILGAELGTYEYEGKPRDVFKLHLVDNEGEKYLLSCSFTQLSRGLLNTLCGMDNYNNIEMSLYIKGSIGKDGKEYVNPRISVRQNGIMCKWKYSLESLPKPEPIKNSKGEVLQNDYSLVDEFWKKEIPNINAIAKKGETGVDDEMPF